MDAATEADAALSFGSSFCFACATATAAASWAAVAADVKKATAVSGLSCYCSAAAAATDSADANSKTFPGALKKAPSQKERFLTSILEAFSLYLFSSVLEIFFSFSFSFSLFFSLMHSSSSSYTLSPSMTSRPKKITSFLIVHLAGTSQSPILLYVYFFQLGSCFWY